LFHHLFLIFSCLRGGREFVLKSEAHLSGGLSHVDHVGICCGSGGLASARGSGLCGLCPVDVRVLCLGGIGPVLRDAVCCSEAGSILLQFPNPSLTHGLEHLIESGLVDHGGPLRVVLRQVHHLHQHVWVRRHQHALAVHPRGRDEFRGNPTSFGYRDGGHQSSAEFPRCRLRGLDDLGVFEGRGVGLERWYSSSAIFLAFALSKMALRQRETSVP
jgi:hypothetical protein